MTWTKEERERFFAAATNDRLEAIYILAVRTGLREGELLGLTWKKVVIERDTRGHLIVDQQLEEAPLPKHCAPNADKSLRLAPPKSDSSNRFVSMGAQAIAALQAHRKRMEAEALADRREVTETPFVFCTRTGTAMHRSNLANRSWKPILDAADVPKPRFHGLRGLHASLLHAAGTPDMEVSKRSGHSDVQVTQKHYITAPATADREAGRTL